MYFLLLNKKIQYIKFKNHFKKKNIYIFPRNNFTGSVFLKKDYVFFKKKIQISRHKIVFSKKNFYFLNLNLLYLNFNFFINKKLQNSSLTARTFFFNTIKKEIYFLIFLSKVVFITISYDFRKKTNLIFIFSLKFYIKKKAATKKYFSDTKVEYKIKTKNISEKITCSNKFASKYNFSLFFFINIFFLTKYYSISIQKLSFFSFNFTKKTLSNSIGSTNLFYSAVVVNFILYLKKNKIKFKKIKTKLKSFFIYKIKIRSEIQIIICRNLWTVFVCIYFKIINYKYTKKFKHWLYGNITSVEKKNMSYKKKFQKYTVFNFKKIKLLEHKKVPKFIMWSRCISILLCLKKIKEIPKFALFRMKKNFTQSFFDFKSILVHLEFIIGNVKDTNNKCLKKNKTLHILNTNCKKIPSKVEKIYSYLFFKKSLNFVDFRIVSFFLHFGLVDLSRKITQKILFTFDRNIFVSFLKYWITEEITRSPCGVFFLILFSSVESKILSKTNSEVIFKKIASLKKWKFFTTGLKLFLKCKFKINLFRDIYLKFIKIN